MQNTSQEQNSTKAEILKTIIGTLDNKQAENIKVLNVEKQTSLCSYFVICEGRALTHVKALADEVEEKLSEIGIMPLHREKYHDSAWIALDYASVIVHIFDRQNREFYSLEKLWRDSPEVDLKVFLTNS